MFRGFTQFVCNDCGHKFTGPDMEWMCTVYPAPVKCPKCGGWHTYPSEFHVCLTLDGFISTAGGVAVACGAGLWAIDRNKKPVVQRDVAFIRSQVITISLFLTSSSMLPIAGLIHWWN